MQDRAILAKCLTNRVSLKCSHLDFPKIVVLQKMVAILNSQIFRKICKTQKCLYLENCAR